jgi:kynurenine formamidase
MLALIVAAAISSGGSGKARLTKQDVDEMVESLSNWGRWGKEDQLGTLNLITPAKRKEAAALVQEGVSVSLAHNVLKQRAFDSPPFEHRMVETGLMPGKQSSSDVYSVQYHGFTVTHMDALCHVFYGGKMYNGFSKEEVTDKGAGRLSVINAKNGILTRGVLLDFPRLLGVKYLKGSRAIYPQDLDAWERKAGVKVGSGDAVFVRTGRWARYEAEGEWDALKDSAGLDVSCMAWLKKRDVAVLGSDLASDVMPSGIEDGGPAFLPVHLVAIVAMGLPILDNCDLETVSEAAAARERWTFLLTVAPLAVEGGTGSPVNPVATF